MNLTEAKKALKTFFGYDDFRPQQSEIIDAVYQQKDSLVLMPTGGGKSICFQIPAVTLKGTCVVISPLIALMKDQVEGLRSNGIQAAYMNSTLDTMELRAIENDLMLGKIKLLYVSPEKAVTQDFLTLMKSIEVNLIAIDEAHCISAWGHDFRPEYTQLKFLKKQFPNTPLMALTATADRLTRKDIEEQLTMQNPQRFIASFDRPNISLKVLPAQKRREQIIDFIQSRPNQSGIIYCLSRKNTENLSTKLNAEGIRATYYHAGMSSSMRSKVQEDFINDKVPVICATIAFGMGIDKSNVRWVIHYNLPKNIEGYYQEIGRAGRDGAKADTLLFYSYADVNILRDIINSNDAENAEIQLAKLDNMQQYAESLICRRKILMNYFSENMEGDCGNCDICKNPPQFFDGTIIAQKAMSAIFRTQQSVGMSMLIDILRGSKRKEILQKNYDKIKTYGVGAEYSQMDWQSFIQQLIQLGYIEIAYERYHCLQLTAAAKEVLFQNKKVELVKMTSILSRRTAKKEKKVTKRERIRNELFEELRQLRKQLAQKKGIPPYLIFSDATLEEMAATQPTTSEDLLNISGVGEKKLRDFGKVFLKQIQNYIVQQSQNGSRVKGATYLVTYNLYKKGLSVEEIVQERNLHETTIYSHLAYLFEKGEDVNIKQYFSNQELDLVQTHKHKSPKEIYESLNEDVPYHIIRLCLTYLDHV